MSGPGSTCSGCGAPLVAGDRFCRACGRAAAPAGPVGGSGRPLPSQAGPPATTPPTTFWTTPVGGAGGARRSTSAGTRLRTGLAGLGRGAVGCLTLLIGLGILGGIVASLEGPGTTPGPRASEPWSSVPGAETLVPETVVPVTPEPTTLQVELIDALEAGLVKMTATGQNLQELLLGLDSLSDEPLQVVVPPGTLFKPKASATQSMVVITETSIYVEPREHEDFVLDVACASMTKATPGSKDTFTLATTGPSADLRKLVTSSGFADASFRVEQFGIWTITNNPTRSGYVGLGTLGVGSGPSSSEINAIKAMFKAAGIDTSKYRALR